MKISAKRLLSLFLATLLSAGAFFIFPLTAYAEGEDNPYFVTGSCGSSPENDVQYYLFKDGTIAFFPKASTGAIKDCALGDNGMSDAPWYNFSASYIMASVRSTKISIESGITAVGAYDFYLPAELTGQLDPILQTGNIELPDSLVSIGAHAFENQIKLEKITFPANLTTIGEDAFNGCTELQGIDYYGDPSHLNWAMTTAFEKQVTLHIKPIYANQLETLNATYAPYNIKVEANLHSTITGDGVERNINISMGQENSAVFGGAAPFVIVGTFSGQKKSVTYGSNGFATGVRIGTDASDYSYYLLENNSSHKLYPQINSGLAGYVTGLDKSVGAESPLKLELSHEYIGSNIVKVKYKLTNDGTERISNIRLGSTGDIKIGADDYAAIKPLTEDIKNEVTGKTETKQVGFYMTSTKTYDQSGNNYATLGFIGKNVEGSADANFFYGPVAGNKRESATGAYRHRLFPNRIFDIDEPETGALTAGAQAEGELDRVDGKYPDSGMSYYWDIDSIGAGEVKEYAVLFSVYGADSTAQNQGQEMVADKEKKHYTVTWDYDYDGDGKADTGSTYKTVVAEGDPIPAYSAETPQKPHDRNDYTFKKWVKADGSDMTDADLASCADNVTFRATYEATPLKFFTGYSLTLEGDIGVYFFIDVTAVGLTNEDIISGRNSIAFSYSWGTPHTSATDLSGYNTVLDKDYYLLDSDRLYFKIKCRTAVAEMTCKIHVDAVVKDRFGNIVDTDNDDYSVREYGEYILGAEANTFKKQEKLVELTKAMLDYGAKAQQVFGVVTGDLANKNVTGYSPADVTVEMIDTAIAAEPDNAGKQIISMKTDTSDFGLNYYGSSVVFLSKTTLRHYYTISNQGLYDSYKNDTTFMLDERKLPYVMFDKPDIAAADLDVLQEFTINGHTYYYAVLSNSKSVLNSTKANDADKALAKATYWYNQKANTYFAD